MDTLIISAKEFRKNFPKYQKLIEQGISITIVKRSKPIFVLKPIELDIADTQKAAQSMKKPLPEPGELPLWCKAFANMEDLDFDRAPFKN